MANLFNKSFFKCLFDLFPNVLDYFDGDQIKQFDGYFHKYKKEQYSNYFDFLSSIELHDILHDAIKNNKIYRQYTIDNADLKNDFAECADKCHMDVN